MKRSETYVALSSNTVDTKNRKRGLFMIKIFENKEEVILEIETVKGFDTFTASNKTYNGILEFINDDTKQYIQIANRIYFKNSIVKITMK